MGELKLTQRWWKKTAVGLLSASLLLSSSNVALAEESNKKETKVETKKEEVNFPDLQIESESAILYDTHLNKIIFEKNADQVTPTASLAKVMTMLLSSEAIKSEKIKEDDLVTISKKAWKTGGSRMFLNVGAKVPFNELFAGLAIVSANDAAVAMAEHLEGSTQEFAKKMNEKAKELDMKNTNFISPNGLPDGENTDVSTARDLMLLSKDYLKKHPNNMVIHKKLEFVTDKAYSGGRDDIQQSNRNPILKDYKGADGLKTGWIDGHYNFIGTAVKDDVRLIVILMTSPSLKARTNDAEKLLNFGFEQYSKIIVNKAGDEIQKIAVYKSEGVKKTQVVIKDSIELVVHNSDFEEGEIKEEIILPKHLIGGKKENEVVGKKNIYLGKKKIATADLVITEDLPKAGFLQSILDNISLMVKWVSDKLF